jgi:CRISPR-associated protein Cmx8
MVLELDYNLSELPSSQHRAGLAGLVLMAQWLTRHTNRNGICEITRLDENGATVLLDQIGLQELFNETYAASKEEQERDKVIKNPRTKQIVPYKRVEKRIVTDPKTGKSKEKPIFIYEFPVPRGAFLMDYDRSAQNDSGLWINLWRDVVWRIFRGSAPAARGPFNKRAEGVYTEDADKTWQALNKPTKYAIGLSSTHFIGAEAKNAEEVPFKDRARFQFLLHFWPFVAQIYIPTVYVYDKNTKKYKTELSNTYAVSMPDVSNLADFCGELPVVLKHNRGVEMTGYRPRDCVIDLAAEGALDLMNKFNQRLAVEAGNQSVSDLLLGVDVFHLEKQGNNIRLWGTARIDPERRMIDEYARVKGLFRYALFRRQRLLNVLNGREWWRGFGTLLSTIDAGATIGSPYFRADTRKAFADALQLNQTTEGETNVDENVSTQPKQPKSVEGLIYQLVSSYITAKLKSKYQLEWQKEWKGQTQSPGRAKYLEMQGKTAREAFLAVRSRTGDDFVEYFVATLCSFPQFLSEEGYATLAQALHQETDKVRTLTMLALSARG